MAGGRRLATAWGVTCVELPGSHCPHWLGAAECAAVIRPFLERLDTGHRARLMGRTTRMHPANWCGSNQAQRSC